jgi:hypothetical protein
LCSTIAYLAFVEGASKRCGISWAEAGYNSRHRCVTYR